MPELPEVETIRTELADSSAMGKQIKEVIVFWPRTLQELTVPLFQQEVVGKRIIAAERKGKYLILRLSCGAIVIHLRMTGKLCLRNSREPISSYERLCWVLEGGQFLCFEDQRKFGTISYVEDPQVFLQHLGVEPLTGAFTPFFLEKILQSKARGIKATLLDQTVVCGLGNIYVDEALWEAQIHPERASQDLKADEIERLHLAIELVLKKGIANRGTSLGDAPSNYFSIDGYRGKNQYSLNVYKRKGMLCSRCGDKIRKMVVAQRGTHFCPTCQVFI